VVNYLSIEEYLENLTYFVRDYNVLDSSLNRAKWDYGGSSLSYKSALIMKGIIRNHPFIDGNKRSSLQLSDAFLRKNGYFFSPSFSKNVIYNNDHNLHNLHNNISNFENMLYNLTFKIAEKFCSDEELSLIISSNISTYRGNKIFGFRDDYPELLKRLSLT
jgi:prophage maintenance system killer protein